MKDKKFYKYFFWVAFSLFIISFALVIIILVEKKIDLSCTLKFFESLFFILDIPIKILAAAIAILTIGITVYRAYQFDKGMEVANNNNQFNNYYKHREEFIKEFSDKTFFKEYREITGRDTSEYVKNLYNEFYYSSPNEFSPKINSEIKNKIDKFIDGVSNSKVNIKDYNLSSLQKEEFSYLINLNIPSVNTLISSMTSKLIPSMRIAPDQSKEVEMIISSVFVYMYIFYWSISLYSAVLLFDGSKVLSLENFINNYSDLASKCSYSMGKGLLKKTRELSIR